MWRSALQFERISALQKATDFYTNTVRSSMHAVKPVPFGRRDEGTANNIVPTDL